MRLTAIDPNKWGETAYYEVDWFRGCELKNALAAMAKNNRTIIVDRAFERSLKVGDTVNLKLARKSYALTVVGFFAPRTSQIYWSYVSCSLLDGVGDIIMGARIIARLRSNDVQTIKKAYEMFSSIGHVSSVEASFSEIAGGVEFSSLRDIRSVGAAIAFAAASLGVGLITR